MTTKSEAVQHALSVMAEMAGRREPYKIEVLGLQLDVLPGVFAPKYFTDSEFFAEQLPEIVGNRSFCEIGVGTGLIALKAALGGASYVAGTDINPEAVRNTEVNFRAHGIPITLGTGDIFDPLPEKMRFDVIFWNHPWNNVSFVPETMLQRSGLDTGYASLEKYFRYGRNRLIAGGQLLLGTGTTADLRDIYELGRKYDYARDVIARQTTPFAQGAKRAVELRVYSFTPR